MHRLRGPIGDGRWPLLRRALGFVLLLLAAAPAAGAAPVLLDVRHGVWPDHTRIVLDLSASTEYSQKFLADPPRIAIEIPGASLASGLSPRTIQDALVRGVRVTRLRGPSTLVTIDLARACSYRVFTLGSEDAAKPRIVVDVYEGDAPPPESVPEAVSPSAPPETGDESLPQAIPEPPPASAPAEEESGDESAPPAAAPQDDAIEEFTPAEALRVKPAAGAGPQGAASDGAAGAPAPSSAPASADESVENPPEEAIPAPATEGRGTAAKDRKRLVAIDAGHGGPDSGARRGSTLEKVICLDFAKKLAAAINKVDGYEAFLTRDTDVFLPLRRRYQAAESQAADVFVSIHANAARSRSAFGTEVFFLSLGGASDEASRELAAAENASDEIGGVSPGAEEDLASILRDLRRSDALRRSSFLAESVLEELQKIPGVESRGVKQAGFTVLKSPEMPSILVETGFLSNANERNRLTDPKYQDLFVRRLRDGVLGFFQKYGIAQP